MLVQACTEPHTGRMTCVAANAWSLWTALLHPLAWWGAALLALGVLVTVAGRPPKPRG